MYEPEQITQQLVDLSNWLGAPEQDCAILGEGNTSARISEKSFLVKASGTELGTLTAEGFVEIDIDKALAMIDDPGISDEGVRDAMNASKIDPSDVRMPSVETPLHAICLNLEGIDFVGHTHPTAINAITCSNDFDSALESRIFPDEIVVCGTEPLLVPYVDPGVVLARIVKERIEEFVAKTGEPPKTIYMQNHGFIALGDSAKQVRSITAMAVKAARIRVGTRAFGGTHPMDATNVTRIETRPDEHYRQKVIGN